MSFLADLQTSGRVFPRQDNLCFGEFRPVGTHLGEFRRERLRTNRVARGWRRGTLRPRQATKEQGSSGQSYMHHTILLPAPILDANSCYGHAILPEQPEQLDAGPEWEDNTGWSGTSKQVRTRKPFEP